MDSYVLSGSNELFYVMSMMVNSLKLTNSRECECEMNDRSETMCEQSSTGSLTISSRSSPVCSWSATWTLTWWLPAMKSVLCWMAAGR